MWVYIQTEPGLYTVGFYDSEGKWHPDSDGTQEECAKRVHYLNGGESEPEGIIDEAHKAIDKLFEDIGLNLTVAYIAVLLPTLTVDDLTQFQDEWTTHVAEVHKP